MAMPTSGTLYLCTTNATAISQCRSIAHAVYLGSPPSNVSLCGAGLQIGCSLPIRHSCFYGYAAPTNSWSFSVLYGTGIDLVTGSVDLQNNFGSVVESFSVDAGQTGGIFQSITGTYRVSYNLTGFSGRSEVGITVTWQMMPIGMIGSSGGNGQTSFASEPQAVQLTVSQMR